MHYGGQLPGTYLSGVWRPKQAEMMPSADETLRCLDELAPTLEAFNK